MHTTIIIPTYKRPQSVKRCLESLQRQECLPDEVIVVARESDEATRRLLSEAVFERLNIREVNLTEPGNVAAYNAGLDVAKGDIIAFTDDDTTPHPDWLARMVRHFRERPHVGGVGGRDWMYIDGELQGAAMHPGAGAGVGRLQWHGRIIGNHHLGEGTPHKVDVLKGANMSYRREALKDLSFDERLRGHGTKTGSDFMLSLSVKQKGWTLLYDPAVAVDHHLASRIDERDTRPALRFSFRGCADLAHNRALLILEHLPWYRRAVFLAWCLLVGTRDSFGAVQMLRFLPQQGLLAARKWQAAALGRWRGWRTFRQSKRAHGRDRS